MVANIIKFFTNT